MSPTDDYFCLPQIAQICTDLFLRTITFSRGKQTYPPYHSPFKRRTNQSSPLQGEIEGVSNQKHKASHILTSLPSPLKGEKQFDFLIERV